MRITSKGQVTIPMAIREKAGLLPNTDVEFSLDGKGAVRISKARKGTRGRGETRGDKLIAQMRRAPKIKMTTEEIMKLTRGWS
jgi:AbrB family looped-hinge helix DNA binding protein